MAKWLALALALASGAQAVTLDPGWVVLDSFSAVGNLAAPNWTITSSGPTFSSDGARATPVGGVAMAAFKPATFPGTSYPQRTRLSLFSGGTSPQYFGTLLGYQDANNYLEVRATLNAGNFYQVYLYEVSSGSPAPHNQVLALNTYGSYGAIRLDASLLGKRLDLVVQPLVAATGEPTGSPISFAWTDITTSTYANTRAVGIRGFGPVKIDDYLGYTLPEPMTWVLLAGSSLILRRSRRPRALH